MKSLLVFLVIFTAHIPSVTATEASEVRSGGSEVRSGLSRFEKAALKQFDESSKFGLGNLSVTECTSALKSLNSKIYRYALVRPPSKAVVRQTLAESRKYSASRANFATLARQLLQHRTALLMAAHAVAPLAILGFMLYNLDSYQATMAFDTALTDFIESFINHISGIITGTPGSVALPFISTQELVETALFLYGIFFLINGILAFLSAQFFLFKESVVLPPPGTSAVSVAPPQTQSDKRGENSLAIVSTIAAVGVVGIMTMASKPDLFPSNILELVPNESMARKKPRVRKVPKKRPQPKKLMVAPPPKKVKSSPRKKATTPRVQKVVVPPPSPPTPPRPTRKSRRTEGGSMNAVKKIGKIIVGGTAVLGAKYVADVLLFFFF